MSQRRPLHPCSEVPMYKQTLVLSLHYKNQVEASPLGWLLKQLPHMSENISTGSPSASRLPSQTHASCPVGSGLPKGDAESSSCSCPAAGWASEEPVVQMEISRLPRLCPALGEGRRGTVDSISGIALCTFLSSPLASQHIPGSVSINSEA